MIHTRDHVASIPSKRILENDSSNAESSTSIATDSFQTSQETLRVPRSETEKLGQIAPETHLPTSSIPSSHPDPSLPGFNLSFWIDVSGSSQ